MNPARSSTTMGRTLAAVVLGTMLFPLARDAEAQFPIQFPAQTQTQSPAQKSVPFPFQFPGQKDAGGNPFDPGSFADFDKFFEQMMGGSTEVDQKKLESIPVSLEEERELGKQLIEAWQADMKQQGIKVIEKGRDVTYLKQLVETLKPHMKNAKRYPKIRVLVFDSPNVDARSCPGGTLIFSTGLLDFVDSEAALAGIVGHELSHLDHGHQLLPIRRMKLMQQMPAFTDGTFSPQKFFSTGEMLMRLWRPFRPAEEAAADRDAADWSFAAGYDPHALAAEFDKLQRRNPSLPIPSMFRSHPATIERYQAITARADELQGQAPNKVLYIGKENLRRRIPRSKKEFPE